MGQDPRRASIEAYWTDNLALDSEYDYDPFWARCVELCIAPTAHSHAQGHGLRRSYSNYLYNQIGHFADAGEAFAKALFFGGVTRRFPDLNVGILEGGVGWACSLYAGLVSAWRKRGGEAIHSFNPSKIDYDRLAAFFESHGGEAFAETAPGDGDGESARLGYVNTATDGLTSAQLALTDGTPDAVGLLAFLNDPSTTVDVLDHEVPLDARAAKYLIAHRDGADGVFGTADDNLFDDVAEVDSVYWVGPKTINRIAEFAWAEGWTPVGDEHLGAWDGVIAEGKEQCPLGLFGDVPS